MLQTLVENAIKHGIGTLSEGGRITIRSTRESAIHQHVLEIINTGTLNGSEHTPGFGISSTQSRLVLLYGSAAHFDIVQLPERLVKATVRIPI
jgi:LytS/YehU family sensor histidine kinase